MDRCTIKRKVQERQGWQKPMLCGYRLVGASTTKPMLAHRTRQKPKMEVLLVRSPDFNTIMAEEALSGARLIGAPSAVDSILLGASAHRS